jgi:hypothetical protein
MMSESKTTAWSETCECGCESRAASPCGRCGSSERLAEYVLYLDAACDRDRRIVVHGACIADDVARGAVVRVSPFAYAVA